MGGTDLNIFGLLRVFVKHLSQNRYLRINYLCLGRNPKPFRTCSGFFAFLLKIYYEITQTLLVLIWAMPMVMYHINTVNFIYFFISLYTLPYNTC